MASNSVGVKHSGDQIAHKTPNAHIRMQHGCPRERIGQGDRISSSHDGVTNGNSRNWQFVKFFDVMGVRSLSII